MTDARAPTWFGRMLCRLGVHRWRGHTRGSMASVYWQCERCGEVDW